MVYRQLISNRGVESMRKFIKLMDAWNFTDQKGNRAPVELPHTWNAIDGQDGGNDYYRGTLVYDNHFVKPKYTEEKECVYLQFHGINSSANVILNGESVCRHDGGYSTFRVDVTDKLQEDNYLAIEVDNSVNDRVYPQKADFTFYGGIYRDIEILIVKKEHFDLDYYGGPGIKYTTTVSGKDADVNVMTYINEAAKEAGAKVVVELLDAKGNVIADGEGQDVTLHISNVHLWDGLEDPYLYEIKATLVKNGTEVDEISCNCGVRTFEFSPKDGFHLNGRPYPLHGVSRHQDYRGIGNAIGKEQHDRDMELIREVGANTIRLAHYQHDQYFYDLCDKVGMIVWAEIPYISEHLANGNENTISQMKELIVQNYNHPSIVVWGVSNEITISGRKYRKQMLENHHVLNDLWISFYHLVYPKRCLCYSEYGAEGMPNLHSKRPKRGDNSEEYHSKYHEYMLECFKRHPYMWAHYYWNMFDFAADARNQGGEPGMNHKGLITFDRKTKKDAFYLYKAYWNKKDKFVYLAGKRYEFRSAEKQTITVYSNLDEVSLYHNGKLVGTQKGEHVFKFQIVMEDQNKLEVKSGDYTDCGTIYKVGVERPEYRLAKGDSSNWM